MFRRKLPLISAVLLGSIMPGASSAQDEKGSLPLTLRSRVAVPGEKSAPAAEKKVSWDPKKTAIIVCDMWTTTGVNRRRPASTSWRVR